MRESGHLGLVNKAIHNIALACEDESAKNIESRDITKLVYSKLGKAALIQKGLDQFILESSAR
jgi:hypothetical protein